MHQEKVKKIKHFNTFSKLFLVIIKNLEIFTKLAFSNLPLQDL